MATIRYMVKDVDRSISFYAKHLGFQLDRDDGPAFAVVSRGDLTLWLSGPQSSAARPMPDGRRPEPGGWNRLVLQVEDLGSRVAEMKQAGIAFRNEIVVGPGGKQILVQDPDGNLVELFEPAPRNKEKGLNR
ncbi:MAG TPA: VOC family protein [Blastocatellia bacterium]|nr:VOC family protein [Blastocatellia bacterium]